MYLKGGVYLECNVLQMLFHMVPKGIHWAGRQTGDESCKADAHLTPDADVPETPRPEIPSRIHVERERGAQKPVDQ